MTRHRNAPVDPAPVYVTITNEMIEKARTPAGGFNYSQMAVFSFRGLETNWKRRLIGSRVLLSDYERFVAAGNRKPRQSRNSRNRRRFKHQHPQHSVPLDSSEPDTSTVPPWDETPDSPAGNSTDEYIRSCEFL